MSPKNKELFPYGITFLLLVGVLSYSLFGEDKKFSEEFIFSEEAAVGEAMLGEAAASPTKDAVHVPIIVYHSVRPYYSGITAIVRRFTVPPEVFEEQLNFLEKNGYEVIGFQELYNHFNQNAPLPEKPVILSFDDGWKNQYT